MHVMPAISRLLCCCLALCLVAGCATAGNGLWVELKGKRFTVEVADDEEAMRAVLIEVSGIRSRVN